MQGNRVIRSFTIAQNSAMKLQLEWLDSEICTTINFILHDGWTRVGKKKCSLAFFSVFVLISNSRLLHCQKARESRIHLDRIELDNSFRKTYVSIIYFIYELNFRNTSTLHVFLSREFSLATNYGMSLGRSFSEYCSSETENIIAIQWCQSVVHRLRATSVPFSAERTKA